MPALLSITGIIAIIAGVVGYFTGPYGLSMGIKSIMNLAENGMIYPKYMHPTGPGMRPDYYLFAITNPEVVLNGGKASFALKGPYKFEEVVERDKIKFSQRGEKVAFETKKSFVLNEASLADLDERMWLINPIMLATSQMAKSIMLDRVPFRRLAEPLVFNVLDMAYDSFGERLIIRTTPRKMLVGRKILAFESMASFGIRYGLESYMPGNVFSLVSGKNETSEVWTGVGETKDKFADVTKYQGKKRMEVWREGKCNRIVGTNGELYKPFPKPGRPIKIFIGALCRSLVMDPINNGQLVKTEHGPMALEYELSERLYQSARNNPSNGCYCVDMRTYDCQYDGLLPMGPCYSGAPLYLSRANFKNVDPRIRDLVDWQSAIYLNRTDSVKQQQQRQQQLPDRQLLRIDPITGLVLECEMTMMALFKIVRHPRLKDLSRIQPLTYMPLFVISESFKLPPEAAWIIYTLQKVYDYQGLAMMGTALTGVGLLVLKTLG